MIYWPSPAKLNLFLYITGKRNDGYHTIQTLFQFLNYGDIITIKSRRDKKLNLLTPFFDIKNRSNLVIRAAILLKEMALKMNRLPISNGVDITINKRLPIGGGLGGGSSNAATILIALNHLWKCGFTEDELLSIGLLLGADVPIFIHGYSSFAEGIGELFLPAYPQEKWYLIVCPKINISTSAIFENPELLYHFSKVSIKKILRCEFTNSLESIVRKNYHEVDDAFSWILKYTEARLTGTGSCIFAEFDTKSSAYEILKLAPRWLNCFIAKGKNISPLKKMTLSLK